MLFLLGDYLSSSFCGLFFNIYTILFVLRIIQYSDFVWGGKSFSASKVLGNGFI